MQPLALFDLDFTMLDGDSEFMWSRFLFDQKLVGQDFMDGISAFYRDYDAGCLDIYVYQSFLLGPLTLLSVTQREHLLADYMDRVRLVVRPEMLAVAQRHRDDGYEMLLISATNHFLVEPTARLLGFNNIICTNAKRDGEAYTTMLEGIPAFREGKVRRLEQWLAENGLTLEGSWGYSDSFNDLPLLELVTHPVAVKPDARLEQHARQRGWMILDF